MSLSVENKIFSGIPPPYLQGLSKIIGQVPETLFNTIVVLVLDQISKKPLPPRALAKLSAKGKDYNLEEVVGGLRSVVEAAIRAQPGALEEKDLLSYVKTLKFPDAHAALLVSAYKDRKSELVSKTASRFASQNYLILKNLNWRVDITISSDILRKNLDTVIIFKLLFANGEERVFEASVKTFHMLRLCVASMLQELQTMEKKNSEKRW